MTVLHDIDSAAYAVRHGFAGDIIPVAPNFNIVRIPHPEGGDEYRVYSYRTLVAIVTRALGTVGVRVGCWFYGRCAHGVTRVSLA